MNWHAPGGFAQYVRNLAGFLQEETRSDGELLAAFADTADQGAFTALVARHGPAVWASCLRATRDRADAEDAFQATFISLARQARVVRSETVGGWLQSVVRGATLQADRSARRRDAAHRRLFEQATTRTEQPPPDEELRAVVHEELAGLPERLRVPLMLYYLEGKTQAEVGRLFGVSEQAVAQRLRKGLGLLRARLSRRGMAVTTGVLATVLGGVSVAAAVPTELLTATTAAALRSAAGPVPASLAALPLTRMLMIVAVGAAVGVGLLATGRLSGPAAPTAEVSGTVLLGDFPLDRAEVVLVPDHGEDRQCRLVRVVTDRDGRFRLPVGANADQVAPGRYRVLVHDFLGDGTGAKVFSVPRDYRGELRTPLRLAVGTTPVVFDIPITPVLAPGPRTPPLPSPPGSKARSGL